MAVHHEEVLEIFRSSVPAGVAAPTKFDKPLLECGINSLDLANFLLGIEEKYEIKISEQDFEKLNTINDIMAYLNDPRSGG